MRLLINYKILFPLLLVFSLSGSAAVLPDSFVEHFSEEHGLEQSSILEIIQDQKGFLWLGTFDGLIRYDPEFSVEELGKQVNLSKTTFFNKVKSLTGSSPIEFIREIRLSQAAKILAEENVLVKEACYQVGFSDLKYFGKCFKAKYNLTPAEYRKKYRQVRK